MCRVLIYCVFLLNSHGLSGTHWKTNFWFNDWFGENGIILRKWDNLMRYNLQYLGFYKITQKEPGERQHPGCRWRTIVRCLRRKMSTYLLSAIGFLGWYHYIYLYLSNVREGIFHSSVSQLITRLLL